jgi:hypothetical protein
MGPLKHVVITLTDGRAGVDYPRVVVSRKRQEEVCWHSPQGEATIDFVSTPFESDLYLVPKGGSVATGRPVGINGIYRYSITLRVPRDRRGYVVDLEVDVEA